MKKLLLILILLLSLTGCGEEKESKLDPNSEIVVETIQIEEIRVEPITIE